jgi:hypothetical protein
MLREAGAKEAYVKGSCTRTLPAGWMALDYSWDVMLEQVCGGVVQHVCKNRQYVCLDERLTRSHCKSARVAVA